MKKFPKYDDEKEYERTKHKDDRRKLRKFKDFTRSKHLDED